PSLWPVVGVALVLLAIQMTLGNIIAPKVFGDRLNLSPVVILLFLVFWGWLWGITGALLAVPLAAAIQIALAHIPALAPLAVLMGSGKRYAKRNPPPENRAAADNGD
ncbi:MAG: AI-2E family transporter, partial [Kiritimatiellia bacterium]